MAGAIIGAAFSARRSVSEQTELAVNRSAGAWVTWCQRHQEIDRWGTGTLRPSLEESRAGRTWSSPRRSE